MGIEALVSHQFTWRFLAIDAFGLTAISKPRREPPVAPPLGHRTTVSEAGLMDLPALRSFLTIADRGSFSQAARDLGVTQPAISQQIARLETELGKSLFDRRG